jgi:hypothetical protein
MAFPSRKREQAFAAMLDDLAASKADQRHDEDQAAADASMADIVSRLQAMPIPGGGMPAEARAKLMAIAATELPAQAAERRPSPADEAQTGAAAATTAPRPSPRPRPTPAARPATQAKPRLRITDRFSLPAWTPLATGAVAAVVAVTGIGVAVSHALPDSWLHDKNATNTVRLNASQSDAALQELNTARGAMNALVLAAYHDATAHNGTVSATGATAMSSALTRWEQLSSTGTSPLLTSAKAGDATARERLLKYTSDEVGSLNRSLPTLPSGVKEQVQQDIAKLQAINKSLGASPVPTG